MKTIPAIEKFLTDSERAASGLERFEAIAQLVATVGQPAEDIIRKLLPENADQLLQACSLYKLHTRPDFYTAVRDELAAQLFEELSKPEQLQRFEVIYNEGGTVTLRLLRDDDFEKEYYGSVGIICARNYCEALEGLEVIKAAAAEMAKGRVIGWSLYATAEAMERYELATVISTLPINVSVIHFANKNYDTLARAAYDAFVGEVGENCFDEQTDSPEERYTVVFDACGAGLWPVAMHDGFKAALARICGYQLPV